MSWISYRQQLMPHVYRGPGAVVLFGSFHSSEFSRMTMYFDASRAVTIYSGSSQHGKSAQHGQAGGGGAQVLPESMRGARQYYHSRTCLPLTPYEIQYDSDDDLDDEWVLNQVG